MRCSLLEVFCSSLFHRATAAQVKMKTAQFLVFAHFLSVALCVNQRFPVGTLIGYGCTAAIQATYCPTSRRTPPCTCRSVDYLGSYIYCGFQEAHTDADKQGFERYLMSTCPNLTHDRIEHLYNNVSDYLVDTSKIRHFNRSAIIHFPVYYNQTRFVNGYESYRYYRNNFFYSLAWGSGIFAYWALILVIGGIENWFTRLFPTTSIRMKRSIGQSVPMRWWRKNVSLPALFNGKHAARTFFGGIIPTRFESIVLFLFFCLLVIAEAVMIHVYPYGTIWQLQKSQLTRFIGDRTGIVSCFLMVLAYLFAGRNNIFLWITGWKQSTFLTFHKWLARMTIALVLTHTIVFVINSLWIGNYATRIYTNWWRTGSLAMVAGGIMAIQSLSWLRVYSYELFLYFHIFLAVVFLGASWKHLERFDYGHWAYASAAIWVFDRVLRLGRIALFGLKTAKITVISNEILELKMPRGFKIKKPTPGSFGYVYFVHNWLWFQSHPFTIIKDDEGNIKFLIKIKNGVTKKMHDHLMNEPQHTSQVKVAIEGFYGEYKQAYSYDEAIMVTSSNGIPGIYEYISDIDQRKKSGQSKTKLIKLYWTIRHWHSIDWFHEELKKLQKYEYVQTTVYVTKYHEMQIGKRFDDSYDSMQASENTSIRNESEKEAEKECVKETGEISSETSIKAISQILKEFPHVDFKASRPDIAKQIHDDIQEASSSDNIAVLACAHNEMCDEIRRTVAHESGEPRAGRIDLFELLQSW